MKVALVTHPASSVLLGGPRVQVEQTAVELKKLGVKVSTIDGSTKLSEDRVDLVHIFGAGMGTYHLARALHLRGVPFVVSPIYITRRPPWQVRALRAADGVMRRMLPGFWTDYGMIAEMCSWARMVATNTEEEGRIFRESFGVPAARVVKIPNGFERRFTKARPDAFTRAYGMKDFILNVGHVGPARKNIRRLVEALSRIDHPAVIIGRIEETAEARAILRAAEGNPRLRILPHLDHDDPLLVSAYAACKVFVLPSLFETPGIAALEAAAAGARVVITPHGGTREYFGEMAEYVDPYSVDDITRGIRESLDRQSDDALHTHVVKSFLWSEIAGQTKRVYQSVLNLEGPGKMAQRAAKKRGGPQR